LAGTPSMGFGAGFSPINRALFANPAIYRGAIWANHRIR
jgi:hypothetical protein